MTLPGPVAPSTLSGRIAAGRHAFLAGVLLALLALLTACAGTAPAGPAITPSRDRPMVAVSFPILADIAGNVAGDRARIVSVLPPSANLHVWEATPRDLAQASTYDGFLYVGFNLERFLEDGGFRQALRDATVPEARLGDYAGLVRVDKVLDHGDHTHDLREGDPHIWLDPLRVVIILDPIADFLTRLDPAGEAVYRANAAAYAAELEALHTGLERDLAAIPAASRRLVVFHDAYTYFNERYGFETLEVVIRNPGRDPSAREIADLRRTIVDAGVPAVFREPQFNARVLEAVARDLGVPVGLLLTDAFTAEVQTYLDLMRFNRDSLVRYLAPG